MYELNEFEIIKKKYKENNKYENSENYIFKLEEQNEEANEFITEIAKMLKIDIDGIGFDGIKLCLDDFSNAITILREIKWLQINF